MHGQACARGALSALALGPGYVLLAQWYSTVVVRAAPSIKLRGQGVPPPAQPAGICAWKLTACMSWMLYSDVRQTVRFNPGCRCLHTQTLTAGAQAWTVAQLAMGVPSGCTAHRLRSGPRRPHPPRRALTLRLFVIGRGDENRVQDWFLTHVTGADARLLKVHSQLVRMSTGMI